MIILVRLTAVFSILAVSPLALVAATPDSSNPPAVVIERAPESDSTPVQAELARSESENKRLANEVAALRAKIAELETPVSRAPVSDSAEKARADEATARLNTLTAGIDRLLDEKATLEKQLAETRKTEAALREQLAKADKNAADGSKAADLTWKLAEAETKLENSTRAYALLQAENQLLKTSSADQVRLAAELDKLRQEKAAREAANAQAVDVGAKLAETQGKLSTVLNSYSQLQKENEQLKAASSTREKPTPEMENLHKTNAALEAQVAELRASQNTLREQLAAAEKNAAATPSPDLSNKLAQAEQKLAEATRGYGQLQRENDQLKAANASQAAAASEVEKLRQEKAAADAQLVELRTADETLRQQLATAEKAASEAKAVTAPAAASPADATKLAEIQGKLDTALRSFSQLQAENEHLKAATANQQANAGDVENLRRENATLQARVAAAPQDSSSALAATEDKLNTVLRSYTLLQNENDRLKADAARAADTAQSTSARASGEAASQISALFDELRQTKAQSTSLAAENAQLKTRLALVGNPPGTTLTSPVRPGSVQADAIANGNAPSVTVTPAAPAAKPGPRTHVVVAGDSLAKIARNYYGTAGRWDEILRANRDVIKDENVLPIGATLRIP